MTVGDRVLEQLHPTWERAVMRPSMSLGSCHDGNAAAVVLVGGVMVVRRLGPWPLARMYSCSVDFYSAILEMETDMSTGRAFVPTSASFTNPVSVYVLNGTELGGL